MILFLVVVGTVFTLSSSCVNLISFSSLAIKGGIPTPCSKLGDSVCVCESNKIFVNVNTFLTTQNNQGRLYNWSEPQ